MNNTLYKKEKCESCDSSGWIDYDGFADDCDKCNGTGRKYTKATQADILAAAREIIGKITDKKLERLIDEQIDGMVIPPRATIMRNVINKLLGGE